MKRILIVLSLIVAIPYALFPAKSEMPTNYTPPFSWKDLLKIAPCKNFTTPQKTKIATNLTLLIATLGAFYKDPSIALIPLSVALAYNGFYKKIEYSELELKKEDYDYYMTLIKKINEEVYQDILKAEKVFGIRCLKKTTEPYLRIKKPSYASKGFPLFLFPEGYRNFSEPTITANLTFIIDIYNKPQPSYIEKNSLRLSQKERLSILTLIKLLDKTLYKKILLADPQGTEHIIPTHEMAAVTYHTDGLPLFKISKAFFELPQEQQLFIIGHEIGHYALLHLKAIDNCKIFESKLLKNNHDFNLLFGSFRRCQEYEADKFSLLYFKTSPEAAISFLKARSEAEKKSPLSALFAHQTTNKQIDKTHPNDHNRINYIKNLANNPYYGRPIIVIDWDAIIEEHKDPASS